MQNLSTKHKLQRVELLVRGTVQGVGFRPFIYNLASRFGISGTVSNSGEGVIIKAQAQIDRLQLFIEAIESKAPPLARINSVESTPLPLEPEETTFTIDVSCSPGSATTTIPPDIALCDDCLREISDQSDRRYNYPFTNCTNCGPRFTIVENIPYDRKMTSMKVFPMCALCDKEYNDPADRRFHAQPNACQACGPNISLYKAGGEKIDPQRGESPLLLAARYLRGGKLLAIKGLGGFHLSVNACSFDAVELLRKRKCRPDKPLAVMLPDLLSVEQFCFVTEKEKKLLCSPKRPIVLLKRKPNTPLAQNLAPAIQEIGVMLPYTPLHHLLLQQPGCPTCLVMTSGNISGTPICTSNEEAFEKLADICDLFLTHNRDIVTRVDDSVVKVTAGRELIFRRARGFVPSPVQTRWKLPKTIGCGAGLKNTFSLARDTEIFPSQHIGDLECLESYDFFKESVSHLQSVYQLEPEVVVCDLHPDYPSSRFAVELGLPLYKVQHHHAHAVAVMAEHNIDQPVLAIVLDGTGLGDDGTLWGGEILKTGLASFERLGHLSYLPLPGGDFAATEPWRMGVSSLFSTFGLAELKQLSLFKELQMIGDDKISVVLSMLERNFNTPLSSSCGRLFDAIASLLGIRQTVSYEGQAAMELEAIAKRAITGFWKDELSGKSGPTLTAATQHERKWEISSQQFVKMVADKMKAGENIPTIALTFHKMLIKSIVKLIEKLSIETGIQQVVLSGGCVQNSLLFEGFFHLLPKQGLQVYAGNQLPVNDGAISIGQTIIGGLRHVSRYPDESNSHSGQPG